MKKLVSVCAMLAAMLPLFGVAETYTLAGKDESNASAMNGTGSVGWTDSLGTTTKNHNPSAGNDYVVNQNYILRSPAGKSFAFGGDSLTVSGDSQIKDKGANNSTVTIPNLIVTGKATIANGDANALNKIAGAIDIREDGSLAFDVSFDNASGDARKFEVLADVSGAGSLCAVASDEVKSAGPYVKFLGSLAGFSGKVAVQGRGAVQFATIFASSLPGDPDDFLEDGLTVEGNSALKFETSGKLGVTRGVSLGSGACEIYVAEGETVQIDGFVTGSVGFRKTGKGTLALANVSPELLGTVTVAEGTLQLCDVKEMALPAADVTVASGAVLDEHGPAVDHDPLVEATLTGFDIIADGQPHGPVLTVTEPTSGYQVEWSVDGGAYVPTRPTFTAPGVHTVFCRVSATGYMARKLRTTVAIRAIRRIVATEVEKTGDWANATVAGDDAWAAIQGVIDSCGVGDLVLVKAGTYLLTNELSFASSLPSGIILRSDDGEGHLARKTTLLVGGYPVTSNRLVRISAPAAVVDGFTLTNGFVDASCGGGAYLDDCGADGGLRNCDIVGCTAWHEPYVKSSINNSKLGTGGGVYVYNTGCVSNCLIRGNTAFAGGGIYLEGTRDRGDCSPDVIPRVTASTLVGNQVVGYGTDNAFTGSALASYRTALMDRCTVVSNFCNVTAKSQYSTVGNHSGYLYVSDCVFSANHLGTWKTANLPVIGANNNNHVICTGTTFVREGTIGDVFYKSYEQFVCDGNGMIDCQGSLGGSWKEYRNCLFSGNTNKLCLQGTIKAENCTFVNNLGAIYSSGGFRTNRIANCVFYGNANDIYAVNADNAKNIVCLISNCCISATALDRRQGTNRSFALVATNGCNIIYEATKMKIGDLGFVAPSQRDFRLREGSPLLDAGMTLDWMDGASDRDGKPRVVGLAPDIGCYERQEDAIDPPVHFVRAVATEADKKDEWADAYVGLQAAADAAYGETVCVKSGTYDVTEPVTVRSWGVSIVGEGPGATVVDGGLPARTNRIFSINARNVTLSGLTIRNGKVVGANGGGVYVNAVDFAMTNCVVDNCSAYDGGGLYAAANCPCYSIVDTTFQNCWADRYGAGANFAEDAGLAACTFRDSTAYTEGGGAYLSKGFTVSDCVFTNCATSGNGANQKGGGFYSNGSVTSVIERCQFLGCAAKEDGSAFYLGAPCTITDCLFANSCDTHTDWNSGSIIFSAKAQWVDSCVFRANVISGSLCTKVAGGSVITNCVVENNPKVGKNPTVFTRNGGTIPVLVTDCVIRDTYANRFLGDDVIAVGCVFSNVTVNTAFGADKTVAIARNCLITGSPSPVLSGNCVYENCSFVGNAGGVAISNSAFKPAFTNCVFWANTPSASYRGNMGIVVGKNDFDATNRVKMVNCVLQTTDERSTEAPNMCDADKTGATAALTAKAIAAGQGLLFAPSRGDSHSRAGSPLVDAGVWCDWMTEDANDLDGKPRVVGMAPDVGCYERQGDEIDPPYPCTRAVAKAEDKIGVWADAFVGIQSAVDVAYDFEPLYVKAGTYKLTAPVTVKNKSISLIGEGKDVTILDGQGSSRCLVAVLDSGAAGDLSFDGFTFANGCAGTNTSDANYKARGGGIYVSCNQQALRISLSNCRVTGCRALPKSVDTTNFRGAGAYVVNYCAFKGCVFDDNVASNTHAAAIGLESAGIAGVRDSGSLFSDCVISNCQNTGVGGSNGGMGAGLYDFGSKPIWVENTTFAKLNGGNGGAKYFIAFNAKGGSTITNCNFRDCAASYYVLAPGGATSRLLDCRIERCSGGSGIINGIPVVERCVFCGNRSEIFYRASFGPVRNCLFASNTSAVVTLVDTSNQRARFENCTFADNNGNNSSVVSINGGKTNNQVAFVNCALWGNTKDINRTDKTWQETHLVAYTNCLVEAYTEDVPETHEGCIVGQRPRFVSPANADYRPKSGSPLRDKALTLDWMTDDATDLDGKPRRISSDGKAYPDSLPDIGCYECDIPKPGLLLQVR